MSGTQVALLVVAVALFAAGWIARGRREAHELRATPDPVWGVDLDRAITAALTAFQAALAAWQTEGRTSGAFADRVLETFEQRRADVVGLAGRLEPPAGARSAVSRVIAALDRLSAELAPFGDGVALSTPSERALFRAERELVAARTELLHSAIATSISATSAGSGRPGSG